MPSKIREERHRLPIESYQGQIETFFTADSRDGKAIFDGDEIVAGCIDRLTRAIAKYSCIVPIYCFMPNHVHLVIQGSESDSNTWKAMCLFKQLTGYWFSRRWPEHKWQKDFHDTIIEDDHNGVIRYILDNPVKAGLCTEWSEWPYTGSIGIDLQDVITTLHRLP